MEKKSSKKFTISVIIIIVVGLAAIFTAAFSKREIAANVGGEKITQAELNDVLVKRYGQDTLDSLIEKKVIELEAKKEKVKISDKEKEEEMNQYIEQYGGKDAFDAALKQSGLSKKDIEQDVIQYLSIKKMLEPKIKITEDDMKKYFEENKDSFDEKEQVQASHILVDDEKTAEEVEKKIKEGKDFAELAKEYSKDPGSAQNGGDLGYFGKGKMVKEFEDKAFSMKIGEISEPVKTEHGYHIIKLTGKKAAKDAKYEDHKDEIKDTLFNKELQSQYQPWLEGIKAKYDIKNNLKVS
ncbi:peptidylprolyl isomerase [Lederbergia wuyishanensis]|uniref:Foldase protein PrsA n=1 Tax=Lederbergia wuyishanensis TaxID=1347903 RepID=A0ABU0DA43_9BACI|nr:peptidylprolyl isomerase [Lederbergia wuyishanensis]MCJ8009955.1 peptidylprolyl isomerase [Lederbergia wuyishanensis]MDQ0345303.1 foldase protein PrsA [Lederbergia wuyishanensis]